jgi:hypothetical protein
MGTGGYVEPITSVAAVLAVLAVLCVRHIRREVREERRVVGFGIFAAEVGWQESTGHPALTITEPTRPGNHRPPRLMVMMGRRVGRYQVWMSWHQWKEVHPPGPPVEVTFDRTRYLLPLGPGRYPDISVTRRTAPGSRFRPARGPGTGDRAFGRAFVVSPAGDPAPQRLLTHRLRQAMLAKAVPPWSIQHNTLTTAYGGRPTITDLDSRAETIARIADLLGEDFPPGFWLPGERPAGSRRRTGAGQGGRPG